MEKDDERRLKCTAERYCSTLECRITESGLSKRPGFADGTVIIMDTGKLVPAPVWFNAPKSTGLSDAERSLYLNFCPFCGFDMAPRFERFKHELEEARKPVDPRSRKAEDRCARARARDKPAKKIKKASS